VTSLGTSDIRTPCEGKRERGDVSFPTVIGAEYKVADPERPQLTVKINGYFYTFFYGL
jgi:hypothetical protein